MRSSSMRAELGQLVPTSLPVPDGIHSRGVVDRACRSRPHIEAIVAELHVRADHSPRPPRAHCDDDGDPASTRSRQG